MARFRPTLKDIERFDEYIVAKYSAPMVRHSRQAICAYLCWIADQGVRLDDEGAMDEELRQRFVEESIYCNRRKDDRQNSNSIKRIARPVLRKLAAFLVRGHVNDIDPAFKMPSKKKIDGMKVGIKGYDIRTQLELIHARFHERRRLHEEELFGDTMTIQEVPDPNFDFWDTIKD